MNVILNLFQDLLFSVTILHDLKISSFSFLGDIKVYATFWQTLL